MSAGEAGEVEQKGIDLLIVVIDGVQECNIV
jgi:hypothetical protein